MNPIAFTIGPLSIHWYGIILAAGLLSGAIVACWRAKQYGLDSDHILNLVIIATPLGILGARAYYVLFNWDYYSQYPTEIIAIWHGGLAIHGVILVSVIVAIIYAGKQKISFFKLADICAPALILGQAIGRWGNYVNQEAYGRPTDLPWAMYIAGAWRHPTFLYESLWDLAVFFFLLWFSRKDKVQEGDVFGAYLIGYSLGRFFIEGLRTDSLMLGPVRAAQIMSIVFIVAGSIVIYRNHRRGRQEEES